MNLEMISVVVLTYRPIWEKLAATLHSIIIQEKIDLQIVVADDGSEENQFEKIKFFFKRNGFEKYVLLSSQKNEGTVKNTSKGVSVCTGKFIKLISPGDLLPKENTLYEWSDHLLRSGYRWSIGEAVYYQKGKDNSIIPMPQITHPMITEVYLKGDEKKIRWNYVILDDIALGAAVLCERELFQEYIKRIVGKVIYAEDNVYRIMMFDGILADYFSEYSIVYEYGEGVSTDKKADWSKRLFHDWRATNDEMIRDGKYDEQIKKRMSKILNNRYKGNKLIQYIRKIFEPGRISITLKRKFRPRYSASKLPEDIKNRLFVE